MEICKKYVQTAYQSTEDWRLVGRLADEFAAFIAEPATALKISKVNIPGSKSLAVQDVLLPKAIALGFADESENLFSAYKNNRLRPDYFCPLPSGSGILMEVERGKTNQNNMDFLDFWKCHICEHAHYLFLVVPLELRQNQSGKVIGKPFNTVVGHMQSFFIPVNYTNVRGVVVFGY